MKILKFLLIYIKRAADIAHIDLLYLGLSNPVDMMFHIQPWMILSLFPLSSGFEGCSFQTILLILIIHLLYFSICTDL